ncbi:hypothetical protein [uncultured Stenotrophomonas sp.]|uniref:bestrophin-like domain n=1 Tax=uncultured Stenotrophomonas sp. TaxID=165438 RepID=UPI0028EA37E1|nr:hypothetical protein [uncultured Stenotrophomonas sp.]
MELQGSFPYLPLWLITVLLFVALVLARELGTWLRLRRRKSTAAAPDKAVDAGDDKDSVAFATTTVLGLLALLIGFTFSLALGRYDDRRTLVLKEANALGTTWLRADLLEATDTARVRDVLRRYVDSRVAFANANGAAAEVQANARSVVLQNELWAAVIAGTASFRDTPRASLLVTTTNESIDLAAERFAARQDHIPHRILRMLFLFSLLAAGLLGYERARERSTTTLLLLLFSLAVGLVLDLDLPSTGMVNVPQEPMLDLQRSMQPTSSATGAGP